MNVREIVKEYRKFSNECRKKILQIRSLIWKNPKRFTAFSRNQTFSESFGKFVDLKFLDLLSRK